MFEQGFRAYRRALELAGLHKQAGNQNAEREALRQAHFCQYQLVMALRERFIVANG